MTRFLSLPASIPARELAELVRRPRALAVKMLFPLAVAVPLLHSSAPGFYAAMAVTMLLATMAPLGAGAVLSRERSAGLLLRYRLLPAPPGRVGMERVLAGAGVDLLQVVPVLALVMVGRPGAAAWWPALWLGAAATLVAGNLLGALASTVTRSPGEVMLVVLLPVLPALYLAGVFTPFTDPVMGTVTRLLPFTYLHQALLGALGGATTMAPGPAAVGAGLYLSAVLLLARPVGRRLLEAS
ncbi:MAG TPA: ABC transporter permease [Candidatus Dormibacteraeota bacterium]|nr:ABC transporter permease [Candidatus Dormibacteraeota bacterium]